MVLKANLNREGLEMNGSVMHDRGRLRLDVEVINQGDTPMVKLRLEPRYNAANLSSHNKSRKNLRFLLPGHKFNTTFWLEPRVSIESTLIGLRLRAKNLKEDLDLGMISINKRGRPYEGGGKIPRM